MGDLLLSRSFGSRLIRGRKRQKHQNKDQIPIFLTPDALAKLVREHSRLHGALLLVEDSLHKAYEFVFFATVGLVRPGTEIAEYLTSSRQLL